MQVHTYDGTMQSLEDLIKNLKLEDEPYHFDVIRKTVAIYKQGLIYFPGDYYYVKIDEIKDE